MFTVPAHRQCPVYWSLANEHVFKHCCRMWAKPPPSPSECTTRRLLRRALLHVRLRVLARSNQQHTLERRARHLNDAIFTFGGSRGHRTCHVKLLKPCCRQRMRETVLLDGESISTLGCVVENHTLCPRYYCVLRRRIASSPIPTQVLLLEIPEFH